MKLYRTKESIIAIDNFDIQKSEYLTNIYNIDEAANLIYEFYDKPCAICKEKIKELLKQNKVHESLDYNYFIRD